MLKYWVKTSFLYLFLSFCNLCYGGGDLTLVKLFLSAIENDQQFAIAQANYQSQVELLPQAAASYLPKILFNGQLNRNVFYSNDGVFSVDNLYYNSRNWQVNASQALFDREAWLKIGQAQEQIKAERAALDDALQNLIMRTAESYFSLLTAHFNVYVLQKERRSYQQQYNQAQKRYSAGLDSVTPIYEAKAAINNARATLFSALGEAQNRGEELGLITNQLIYLKDQPHYDIPDVRLVPDHVEGWIAVGLKQNFKLQRTMFLMKNARQNLKAITAKYWPKIYFKGGTVAVRNLIKVDVLNPIIPLAQRQSNMGVSLDYPIFEGGLVNSQIRQARAQFLSISNQLTLEHQRLIVAIRKAFNDIHIYRSRYAADLLSLKAQYLSLRGIKQEFLGGSRTMLDILNTQRRLKILENNALRDKYLLIIAILKLKYLSGTLDIKDLAFIDSWKKNPNQKLNKIPADISAVEESLK